MIYLFVLFILLIGVFFDKKKPTTVIKTWWWLEFVILVLLLGFRYNVGGDTLGYNYDYPTNPTLNDLIKSGFYSETRQPLWLIMQALCKEISPDFYFFQFVHAIVVNLVFFWFFKKYCQRPFLMVVFYYLMAFAYFNMETMRQTLAVCCFLLAVPSLLEKRYVTYAIWAIVAFGFHAAGALMILIPPVYGSLTKKYIIFTSLIIIGVFIFMARTQMLENIFQFINISALLYLFDTYSDNYGNMNSVIYDLIFKFSIPFLFLITHRNRSKFYTGLTSLYVISLGMGATFTFFWRITDFFVIPFYVVLINEADSILISRKFRMSIPNMATILVLVMTIGARWLYYNTDYSESRGLPNAHFYDRYLPYHSIFDPVDESVRETIYWGDDGAVLHRN